MKGYYDEDRALVAEIKRAVAGSDDVAGFKTVECSIMELADDIVDSTYDLQDDFKAGFLSLLGLLSLDGEVYEAAAADIRERIEKPYPERAGTRVDGLDVRELLRGIVDDTLFGSDAETDGYLDDPGCGSGRRSSAPVSRCRRRPAASRATATAASNSRRAWCSSSSPGSRSSRGRTVRSSMGSGRLRHLPQRRDVEEPDVPRGDSLARHAGGRVPRQGRRHDDIRGAGRPASRGMGAT